MAFNLVVLDRGGFHRLAAGNLHLLQHGLSAERRPGPVRVLPVPPAAPRTCRARCACPASCATSPWGSAVAVLFVWIYGGYHAPDVAVGPGKCVAVLPGAGDHPALPAAHTYRAYVEDRGRIARAIYADRRRGIDVNPRHQEPAGLYDAPARSRRPVPRAGRPGQRRAALLRLLAEMPPGADARVLYAGVTLGRGPE